MSEEARLRPAGNGQVPDGDGWFVLNAGAARWKADAFGAYTRFEGETRFPNLGINIAVLQPGQPSCHYHAEADQEDFLVLAGECLLLIEGEEHHCRAWDFVHCPSWTAHAFVGAGDGPCALLAVGSRTHDGIVYPVSELALRHRAGVARETRDPTTAYAGIEPDVDVEYQPGWLPGS